MGNSHPTRCQAAKDSIKALYKEYERAHQDEVAEAPQQLQRDDEDEFDLYNTLGDYKGLDNDFH
jgi:hypothetical protein